MTDRIPNPVPPARSPAHPSPRGGGRRRLVLLLPVCLVLACSDPGTGGSSGTVLNTVQQGLPAGNAAPGASQGGAPLNTVQNPTSGPSARPASSAELSIIAPAVPGSKLADWDIRAVHAVDRGTMEVVCEKGAARVVLSIALAADGGPEPPVSTDRYAVFYSARGATTEDADRPAKALAELLRANQAVPPPGGLGPFVPRPRSL